MKELLGREHKVEGQLELAPGCVDAQVCAGSRKMLGLVVLKAQEEVKETTGQGGLHSQQVLEEQKKKRCH